MKLVSCLFPDLKGKAFSFSLLSMILTVGLSYTASLISLSTPFVETAYYYFMLNFVKWFEVTFSVK